MARRMGLTVGVGRHRGDFNSKVVHGSAWIRRDAADFEGPIERMAGRPQILR